MFAPEADRLRLPLAAGQVFRVYRSINPAQVALSGFPGQKAGAFICVFTAKEGVRVAISLDLMESQRLYFYLNDEGAVPRSQVDEILEEALYFVESMGYVMADLELNKLTPDQRQEQWHALPLAQGFKPVPLTTGTGALRQAGSASGAPAGETFEKAKSSSQGALSDETMEARRQRLIANVGRILAAY